MSIIIAFRWVSFCDSPSSLATLTDSHIHAIAKWNYSCVTSNRFISFFLRTHDWIFPCRRMLKSRYFSNKISCQLFHGKTECLAVYAIFFSAVLEKSSRTQHCSPWICIAYSTLAGDTQNYLLIYYSVRYGRIGAFLSLQCTVDWRGMAGVGHACKAHILLLAQAIFPSCCSLIHRTNGWPPKIKVHPIRPSNYIEREVCDGPLTSSLLLLLLFAFVILMHDCWASVETEYASRKDIRYIHNTHHFTKTQNINGNCSLTTFDNSSPKQK